MKAIRLVATAFAATLAAALLAPACSGSGGGSSESSSGEAGGGDDVHVHGGPTEPIPEALCLLSNCSADFECEACTEGRTTCDAEKHRCVACSAAKGCGSGQKCAEAGKCIPEGQTCPVDESGLPTIDCASDADCAACALEYQTCDTSAKKCRACSKINDLECQATDVCNLGECLPACPESCDFDEQCAHCGGPDAEAHACNNHKCAECSLTKACPGGKTCSVHGTCEELCGVPGKVKGTCDADADCAGCQAGAKKCNVPPGSGHGQCGPSVMNCDAIKPGDVLPDPFDDLVKTCMADADCSGAGVTLNIGKLLRDLTGVPYLNDANLSYSMPVCAALPLPGGQSCGVCAPCRVDTDCADIDVGQIAEQVFGPAGTVAASFLSDKVFGNRPKTIHMYCEPVAAGYGVCAPCPGFLNECGIGKTPPPMPGTGTCMHSACESGEPLDIGCSSCTTQLCTIDPYCCTTAWDDFCVEAVEKLCSDTCEGPGNEGCSHGECDVGDALDDLCSPCAKDLCAADPYCCQSGWDANCVNLVAQYCPWLDCAALKNECVYPSDCPAPQGCLWDHSCGPCYADYDCFPNICNQDTGECVNPDQP